MRPGEKAQTAGGRGVPARLAALAAAGIVLAALTALLAGPGPSTAGAQADPDASAAAAAGGPSDLRVYMIALDGLDPEEVNDTLTPMLADLRDNGTWYENARAVFPAETLPNHAAMMTGVAPERNGIVGNDYWVRNEGLASKIRMHNPTLLGADTLTTTLEDHCTISTATPMSKGYLWGLFRPEPVDPNQGSPANAPDFNHPNPDHPGNQRQADFHPKPNSQPGYIIDPDDHVVDQSMMNAVFLPWVRSGPPTPQFVFLNLGDIDRAGHIDQAGALTEGGLTASRQVAIRDTDTLLRLFVEELKQMGAWEETVLIFTSDHSMDWGLQNQDVSAPMSNALLAAGYRTDSQLDPGPREGSQGDWKEVSGGGTAALYVEEDEDILEFTRIAAELDEVSLVATRDVPTGLPEEIQEKIVSLEDTGMDHRDNGDVVVMAQPGFAFHGGNPLPGNHGHPITQPSVLMVSGGHPMVQKDGESVAGAPVYDPEHGIPFSDPRDGPGNLSVAPTVAAIFGMPLGGYDRGPLTEAFEPWALKPHTPCEAREQPPTLSIGDVSVDEGNSGQTEATFTVSLSAPSQGAVRVDYQTADETATAPADYESRGPTTLTFDPGETAKQISIPVNGDQADEPDEAFTVELSAEVGADLAKAIGTATVRDDDLPPIQTEGGQAPASSQTTSAGQAPSSTKSSCKRFKSKRKRRACARKKRG